ncbi:acetolactate synthase regulatory unit [Schizosaccharomyces cryophilus OY26]|uniref:Acetolactate synthase regulatory unit n=1 Tax=Schizosaccharomyces cryophilus (strain OY26 / ATCC MYA-4695 / CBS 11777 / NBRC 106824 / NRRL Y48691) TaxID=653667 RepID=S9VTW5_SCHCR|nr:acetolactate synthase regulatory unit [Schizosaccharomyces cryophilus OY26]EPY49520.1 acetolactate synthase regulatory unit [Schizosaccharomyces cryophilus OY26]
MHLILVISLNLRTTTMLARRFGRTVNRFVRWKTTYVNSPITYKALHANAPLPRCRIIEPPRATVPEAVSNIIVSTPFNRIPKPQRHVFNCLVQNEPGVLSRLSGILAARGFNIDSLVVCATEVENLSRMTIVIRGNDEVVEQARRQIEDIVSVWAVLDYTGTDIVERELLLAKVSLLGPDHFQQHFERDASPVEEVEKPTSSVSDTMSATAALQLRANQLSAINQVTQLFNGRVSDISTESLIIELTDGPDRIDNFLSLLRPFGVLEASRTGTTAMARSPLSNAIPEKVEEDKDNDDVFDLPPG